MHDLIHALLYMGPALLLWIAVARGHAPGERLIALVHRWHDLRRRKARRPLRARRGALLTAQLQSSILAWDLGGRGPPRSA